MKKSNFLALVIGTVSGLFFSLGMCMALLPEWNAFTEGIILGGAGLALALFAVLLWRKMEKKAPLKPSGKSMFTVLVGITGALLLGVGMCMVMVWDMLLWGIVIGILGIVALLCLIPLISGFKN